MNNETHLKEFEHLQTILPFQLNNNQLKSLQKSYLFPYLPEPSAATSNRTKIYISLDDTLVQSIYELQFSNFLAMNDIPYEYNQIIHPDKNYRYDFKINEIFIEFFCYYGKNYEKRTKDKEDFYKEYSLPLKSLRSKDFKEKNYEKRYEMFIDLLKSIGYKNYVFKPYDLELFNSGNKDYLGYLNRLLNNYIEENNTLPNSDEIRDMGLVRLERIIRHYGGYKKVCQLLNLDDTKFRESWENKSIEELQSIYLDVCQSAGEIPTDQHFTQQNLSGFLGYIRKKNLRSKLEKHAREKGFCTLHEKKYNGITPISDLQELIVHIRPYCEELKRIPTRTDLEEKNATYISNAIAKYTSREELSKILSYPTYNEQNGLNKDFTLDSFIDYLQPLVSQLGYFPTANEIYDYYGVKLEHWIKRFGKRKKIAELLGVKTRSEQLNIHEDGFWQDQTNLDQMLRIELLPLCQKLGHIPSESYLKEKKLNHLSFLIQKLGGREKIKQRIHFQTSDEFNNRKPNRYWDDEGQALKAALLPICEKLNHIPSHDYLIKNGYKKLISGLNKYEGNLSELLGYPRASEYLEQAPKGSNQNIEYARLMFLPIVEELGYFPRKIDLAERNLKKLEKTIRHFKGGAKLAEKLGVLTYKEYLKFNSHQ